MCLFINILQFTNYINTRKSNGKYLYFVILKMNILRNCDVNALSIKFTSREQSLARKLCSSQHNTEIVEIINLPLLYCCKSYFYNTYLLMVILLDDQDIILFILLKPMVFTILHFARSVIFHVILH